MDIITLILSTAIGIILGQLLGFRMFGVEYRWLQKHYVDRVEKLQYELYAVKEELRDVLRLLNRIDLKQELYREGEDIAEVRR